jgi:1-deoxy-D-xylulose-5-phosphate synthase
MELSSTCGTSIEALINGAHRIKRFIDVLNDNEWSIAKNVGPIAQPPYDGDHCDSSAIWSNIGSSKESGSYRRVGVNESGIQI